MKIDPDVAEAAMAAVNAAIKDPETGFAVKATINPVVFYRHVGEAIQRERNKRIADNVDMHFVFSAGVAAAKGDT